MRPAKLRRQAWEYSSPTRFRTRRSLRTLGAESNRSASSQADCMAIEIPSATAGWASPAALPTKNTPSR